MKRCVVCLCVLHPSYLSRPVNNREGQRDILGTWDVPYVPVSVLRWVLCWCMYPVLSTAQQPEGQPGHLCLVPSVTVCLKWVVVGAVSVVESPGSCRDGAGSIPATCMALLPKRRRGEGEQGKECAAAAGREPRALPERPAAGGGGVFLHGSLGGMCSKKR